jgi:hypothetical protein
VIGNSPEVEVPVFRRAEVCVSFFGQLSDRRCFNWRYLKMAGQFKFLVVIADDEPLSNKFNDDRRICALTIAQTYLQQTREL